MAFRSQSVVEEPRMVELPYSTTPDRLNIIGPTSSNQNRIHTSEIRTQVVTSAGQPIRNGLANSKMQYKILYQKHRVSIRSKVLLRIQSKFQLFLGKRKNSLVTFVEKNIIQSSMSNNMSNQFTNKQTENSPL